MNHTQQECRKIIQKNKPYVDGKLSWPKFNPNSMDAQNEPNDGVGSVFHLRA